jgi:hypothetical protein
VPHPAFHFTIRNKDLGYNSELTLVDSQPVAATANEYTSLRCVDPAAICFGMRNTSSAERIPLKPLPTCENITRKR